MRAPFPIVCLVLAALALGVAMANPATGALTELDEMQLCFHEYAPAWWNMLVNEARTDGATRLPLASPRHLDRLARLARLLAAAGRAGRDIEAVHAELLPSAAALDAGARAELPWPAAMSKCLLAAHRTGVTASLFNADEETAATMNQA
jgi:hypothetical protein